MTDFFLSAIIAIILAVASFITNGNHKPGNRHQLSAEEQIEIYEQVMDNCVLNK